MNTKLLVCMILLIVVAVLALARATYDLLQYVYTRGFDRGCKMTTDYWLGLGKDVEEMQKEIRYEEEQN